MKTRAAVLRKGGEPWELTELDLDEPKAGEVLIRYEAAGLCHSDEHIRAQGVARMPLVGGHEGAGVIADAMAGLRGAPGYRYATTPHPVAVLTPDQVKERAAQVLDDVVTLLTAPDE